MSRSFRYLCHQRFFRILGKFDAICTFSKLGVDRLKSQMEKQNKPHVWLGEVASEHNLVVNHVDERMMPNRLAQLFILSVYSQLIIFLKEFVQEHPEGNLWNRRCSGNNKESMLEFVIRSLKISNNKEIEKDRNIIYYYCLVRHRFMHSDVKEKSLINQCKKVRKILGLEGDASAPNLYKEINYNDFNLFTRSTKSLAEKLCIICRPTDKQIVTMADKNGFKDLYHHFQHNPKRLHNALRQKFQMFYSLKGAELEKVIKVYLER